MYGPTQRHCLRLHTLRITFRQEASPIQALDKESYRPRLGAQYLRSLIAIRTALLT